MNNIINKNKYLIKNTINLFIKNLFSYSNFNHYISNSNLIYLINLKIKYFTLYNKKGTIPYFNSYYKINYDCITFMENDFSLVQFSINSILNNKTNNFISNSIYIVLLKKQFNTWFIEYFSSIDYLNDLINYTNENNLISNYNELIQNQIIHYELLLLNFNTIDIIKSKSKEVYNPSRNLTYNKNQAIHYAEKYALNYNSKYKSFDENGGDCTNFVSQVINYGGIKTTSTWKPYTNPWLRVLELRDYLIYNKLAYETYTLTENSIGSIIQFFSPTRKTWSHSGIITYKLEETYLYCCHSSDKLNYPLAYVYPVIYPKIRIITPY